LGVASADYVWSLHIRFAEIQTLFGPKARFASPAQACALQLTAEGQSDLIVVMGTGSGKSAIFMAPHIRLQYQKAVVVVVPLQALLADLERRLFNLQIPYITWNERTGTYRTSIILVSADVAAKSNQFLTYFLQGCHNAQIAALYFDEVHIPLMHDDYRPQLQHLSRLRPAGIPITLLTATLLPTLTRMYKIRHTHTNERCDTLCFGCLPAAGVLTALT
jgi:superfamily II DNA helicase RecQ